MYQISLIYTFSHIKPNTKVVITLENLHLAYISFTFLKSLRSANLEKKMIFNFKYEQNISFAIKSGKQK